MPRYYFNIVQPDADVVPDDEGNVLEDDAVARREAIASLRDLIADSLSYEVVPLRVTIEIVKEGIGVLDRVTGEISVPPKPSGVPN